MQSEQVITERGTGTPLVLLHSSLSSKTQWSKLSEQLITGYRIIAIDLYGYGESEFPDSPNQFSLAKEAARIARIIRQHLGNERFHLIGHSYGGATALRLAHENPSRILSLGLYEPVAFFLLDQSEPAYRIMQQVEQQIASNLAKGDIPTATAHFIDFWSGQGTYQGLPVEKQRMLDRYINKVLLDFQAVLRETLRAEDYRNLALPVCLLRSQESPLPTRRVAEVLEHTLPRLEAHWVPGGHLAPITNADEVNPYWINFLRHLREPAGPEEDERAKLLL